MSPRQSLFVQGGRWVFLKLVRENTKLDSLLQDCLDPSSKKEDQPCVHYQLIGIGQYARVKPEAPKQAAVEASLIL